MEHPYSGIPSQTCVSLYPEASAIDHVSKLIELYSKWLCTLEVNIKRYIDKNDYAKVRCLQALESEFKFILVNLNSILDKLMFKP